ncbi:hypothetical protein K439DRAFT_1345081 [Ramaria rubella]|nr:hypothetical protein K439DRAFT_1345081 [Ramaria rubella]
MFCNRPEEAASTPITLLHPIFGQFVDDCKVDISNPKINLFVRELAKEMCKFYDEGRSRAQKFRDLIWNHFGIKLETADIPNTALATDGHATVGYYVYIRSEGRNEACNTKADPALQTAIYYHHHIKNVSLEILGSRFPCIHIYYFGACLGFSGSAFSDRVHFEPLTEIMPLCWSHHETEMFNRVARIFNAFKNAAERLVAYYQALGSKPPTGFNHKNARFPYPTMFTALNSGSLTPFTLTEQPYPDKLLYSGFADLERPIVVKFVRTYPKDLHEFCVSLNSAPTLLGFDKLPGGWFMVVMEFMMDYIPLSEVKKRNLFESAHLNTIHGMVSNVVDKFHNANFVHGDVRDANILVPIDGANVVKFVDFDWGGKVQEVRYPPLVNNIDVWRPPGAFDGELITTEHDVEMVKHIFTVDRCD